MLATFKRECEGDDDIEREIVGDENRLGAFAQHDGLPTRLLDWTISPYYCVENLNAAHAVRKMILSTKDIDCASADLKAMQIKQAKPFPGPEGYAMEAKTRIGIELNLSDQK